MSTRGERLGMAMKARGIKKQLALAHGIGVNDSTISRWIKNGPMSIESAVALCSHLDVSIDWFLTGKGLIDQHKMTSRQPAGENLDLMEAFRKNVYLLSEPTKLCLLALLDSIIANR